MYYCEACENIVCETSSKTCHRFPTWNPALLALWVKKLRRHNSWKPTSTSVLCSDHFEESCFDTKGNVKHIKADAVPTLFFTGNNTQNKDYDDFEKPKIISVVSLDNLFKSSSNKESSVSEPLTVFHQKIDEICQQKKAAERKKILLQLLLASKRFAINQHKIKIVLNRSRLLRRKMMQNAMIMMLLTQQMTDNS